MALIHKASFKRSLTLFNFIITLKKAYLMQSLYTLFTTLTSKKMRRKALGVLHCTVKHPDPLWLVCC